MTRISVLLFFLITVVHERADAFMHFGKYPSKVGFDLNYVVTKPLSTKSQKQEVWIYQDGDGNVLRSFSAWQNALLASGISQFNNITFVWPELRREAVSTDLKRYCELDYFHRIDDLHSLIDSVKKLPFIDLSRIVLVGSSAGSEIVTFVANQRNDIAAVVTIGGGVLQLADYCDLAGQQAVLKNTANECKEGSYEQRSGLFWKQLLFSDFYNAITATKVPYLAVVGKEDLITRNDITFPHAIQLEGTNPSFHYKSVPNMEHGFGLLRPWQWSIVKKWTSSALHQ